MGLVFLIAPVIGTAAVGLFGFGSLGSLRGLLGLLRLPGLLRFLGCLFPALLLLGLGRIRLLFRLLGLFGLLAVTAAAGLPVLLRAILKNPCLPAVQKYRKGTLLKNVKFSVCSVIQK